MSCTCTRDSRDFLFLIQPPGPLHDARCRLSSLRHPEAVPPEPCGHLEPGGVQERPEQGPWKPGSADSRSAQGLHQYPGLPVVVSVSGSLGGPGGQATPVLDIGRCDTVEVKVSRRSVMRKDIMGAKRIAVQPKLAD